MTQIGNSDSIPDYPSKPDFSTPSLTKAESKQLHKEISQVCGQCLEGMKKLDTFHQHLLMGKGVELEALQVVGSEIKMLGGWIKEHEQQSLGSPDLQRLIRREKVRFNQLEEKFNTLQAYHSVSTAKVIKGSVEGVKSSPVIASILTKQLALLKEQSVRKSSAIKFKAEVSPRHVMLPKEIGKKSTERMDLTPFLGTGLNHDVPKVQNEVYHTAIDVLRTQSFLDDIDAAGDFTEELVVVDRAVDHLQERVSSLEKACARAAASFPGSSFGQTLDRQMSLLHSKLDSLIRHKQALRKISSAD